MHAGGMNSAVYLLEVRENAEAGNESIFVPPFVKGLTINGSNYR